MRTRRKHNLSDVGVSLVELLVVLAAVMLMVTIAVPNITRLLADARMRASMSSLSGVLQNSRMMAVKQNRSMTTFIRPLSGGLVGYVKIAGTGNTLEPTDPQVHLQAPIRAFPYPVGVGAPPGLTVSVLGYSAGIGNASFNSRGLPCRYVSGACTNSGFIRYYKDTRQRNDRSWAAVSISPAGRIKRWFWNGTEWVD
jgi:hypothetical protein